MALSGIEVENYKSFGRPQRIEVRPITVLLGKNNAGKSAVARLPLLLHTGICTDLPEPLDTYARGVDVGSAFTDLIHGHSPHGSVRFGLQFELDEIAGPLVLDSTVQNVVELQMQIVSRCRMQAGDQQVVFEWDYQQAPQRVNRYSVHHRGEIHRANVPFAGLMPTGEVEADLPKTVTSDVAALVRAAKHSFGSVRYLGPFRDRPQRLYRMPTRLPLEIGTLGEDAPSILALDHARYGGELTAIVNRHLRQNLPGWQLSVSTSSGSYSLALTPDWDQTQSINLVDTGTGVAQVLPIFVQRAIDELDGSASTDTRIEIVEQPELHLHPSAHAQLADLYIGASRASDSSRFVIETHSETFILRIRRRIAEGTLQPSHVAIYFVEHEAGESTLRRVGLDSSGNVDYWPEGIFSEDYEETKALANAQIRTAVDGTSNH